MALYNQWKTGTTYNFSTAAPGVLPDTYKQVKLSSISTYRMATKVAGTNIYAQWRIIYPTLPAGTPDTPMSTVWYIFETTDGQEVALAADWIVGESVTEVNFEQYTIAVTQSDYVEAMKIRDMLNRAGVKFTIFQ